MLRKFYFALILSFAFTAIAFAQSGTLKGKVTDKDTKDPIPFANVVVELNGLQQGGTTTDFDGFYTIKPLSPGKYTVKASSIGYASIEVNGVTVSSDQIAFQDLKLSTSSKKLDTIEVIELKGPPLIEKGNATSGGTVSREEIVAAPKRDINSLAAMTGGVVQTSEGSGLNIKGARSSGTAYYVDGMKVISIGLSQQDMEQITTITGGVPAQYGDAVGGIVNITTRGPSRVYSGGAEVVTSELFDHIKSGSVFGNLGHNLAAVNFSGPLKLKYDSVLKINKSLIGFRVSAQVNSDRSSPSAVPMYKVKDDKLQWLQQNPLRPSSTGFGFSRNAEFITKDDLEEVYTKQNAASQSYVLNGKLDFQPHPTMNVSIGGAYTYSTGRNYDFTASLFDAENNGRSIGNVWRVFGKFTQKFEDPAKTKENQSSNIISHAFYTVQVDYTKSYGRSQDDVHKDDIFRYGYLGKFRTFQKPSFTYSVKDSTKHPYDGFYQTGFTDTAYTFDPSGDNATTAMYTSQAYRLNPGGFERSADLIQAGGLLNGDAASSVYSLWYNTGLKLSRYGYSETSQFRVSASGSVDIKNHAIVIGMEYEQRDQRSYSVSAIGLWELMRQKANEKNKQMDSSRPSIDYSQGIYPYTSYERFYNGNPNQPGFYENVRKAFGITNMREYVDIDAHTPDEFKLSMFTPDELLNNGRGLVGYSGYDYLGNKLKNNPTLDDFFTKKDANGNYLREIPSFQPIYVAGYIQDEFAYDDLVFRVGLRVDRFDANQKALKDKYLLYEAKTKSEVSASLNPSGTHPSNVSDNAVVYVNDLMAPNAILGYRDGDKWYDAQGTEISDAGILAKGTSTGKITPYLTDPSNKTISSKVFKDYEPQTAFMPRIAFSFNITNEAKFFAHYDVLTQRPAGGLFLDPTQYLTIQNGGGTPFLNGSGLKPQKTVDYELGFKQVLSKGSVLTLSAFYREYRDLMTQMYVNYAYPTTYMTMGNFDFGTAKGFTVSYELRRIENAIIKAGYTLQFADGSGSSAGTGINLVASGQPNLKILMPLSFDQRHNIYTSFDYRYGSGRGDDKYTGPILFGRKILAAAGANILFSGSSGLPYTKQLNISQEGAMGIVQRHTMAGNINGSRLPWQFRMDAKIDKSIFVKMGKKETFINIYLQIENVLNTINIMGVYPATGNPNDDGYLADADAQADIKKQLNPQSFRDLYQIKINNPGNYSLPRRIYLGASLNF